MATIKISELTQANVFLANSIVPIVGEVLGTATTLRANGQQIRDFIAAPLESNISILQSNLSSVQSQVANLELDVTSIEGNVTTLQSNVSTMDGTLSNLVIDVSTAQSDISMIEGDIDALESNVANLQLDVSTIEANLSVIQTDTSNLASNVSQINSNVSLLGGNVILLENNFANLANVATTGDYTDLLNTPVLANVAISGDYNDLANTPVLSIVATTGDYDDLLNSPVLANVAISGDYNDLTNAPVLANVAISADYNDLANTPAAYGDAEVGVYLANTLPVYGGNIFGLVTDPGQEFITAIGNNSSMFELNSANLELQLTGYGSEDGAVLYISDTMGNVGANANVLHFNNSTEVLTVSNIDVLGSLTGTVEFTMANLTHWTSNVNTIADALNQLAERLYNLENP